MIGEYSRLHNSLKEGLAQLGHTAVIAAAGDSFKGYATDYSVAPRFFSNYYLPRKFKNLFYYITKIDLAGTERALRFYFLLPKLKGFDHVQLINSDALLTHPTLSKWLYKKLLKQNKKMSLLVCGDETPIIDYLLRKELPNSILTPYFDNPGLKKMYRFALKYATEKYRKLFEFVESNSTVLITSDLDYKIPMERMGYAVTHIPNPVNTDMVAFHTNPVTEKVVIFLGINRMSYIKKGIPYFEKALEIIKDSYADKVEIIIAENLPYAQYIKQYAKAHVLLDYTYGMDQGYNALEAMAAGKVVFTGAGKEFMDYYNLTETVALHAQPDATAIAEKLAYLIENPTEIEAIGKQARAFIEKEHYYVKVAERYLGAWG